MSGGNVSGGPVVSGGGILVGRPSRTKLDAMLRSAESGDLTYDHVGSTLDHTNPAADLRARSFDSALGSGHGCFERGVAGLRAWACHAGLGAVLHPSLPPIAEGVTLLVALPVGPFAVVVPNRIVGVVDEPGRFGFAYGTLAGHQEAGEESFLVEQRPDGSVHAVIRVDAVPATGAARAAGPAGRLMQVAAVRRYLRSLRRYVER